MEEARISNGVATPQQYGGADVTNGDAAKKPLPPPDATKGAGDVVTILDSEKGPGDPRRATWGSKVHAPFSALFSLWDGVVVL